MASNPYAQYQRTQIETAEPGKLLVMLYEGALRFLGRSRKCLEEQKLEEANNNLVRVQEIITELMSSLDLETGEVAVSLFRLYEYIYFLLVEANIKKTTEPLDQIERMLVELRDAWKAALCQTGEAEDGSDKERTGSSPEISPVNQRTDGYRPEAGMPGGGRRVNISG